MQKNKAMRTIRLQATIQEIDLPYIERFLKGISASEVSFNDVDTSISKELEIELRERYKDFKKNPEQGIFLEDLKKEVAKQRYGI